MIIYACNIIILYNNNYEDVDLFSGSNGLTETSLSPSTMLCVGCNPTNKFVLVTTPRCHHLHWDTVATPREPCSTAL